MSTPAQSIFPPKPKNYRTPLRTVGSVKVITPLTPRSIISDEQAMESSVPDLIQSSDDVNKLRESEAVAESEQRKGRRASPKKA